METLNFSIQINAPKEKVWAILWDDKTYRQWTSAFMEGSYAISDWEEGSKVQFLSCKGEGMFSTIIKKIPNELMSFKHLGSVKDFKEQPVDEATKKWAGCLEIYTLEEKENYTTLAVTIDVLEDYAQHFREMFPKALEIVKSLSEM